MIQTGQRLTKRIFWVQSAILLLTTGVLWFLLHATAALSFAAGAGAAVLPNWVFAWFAFRHSGARNNKQVLRSFNQGIKVKLLLTMILLVLAMQWSELHPIFLLLGLMSLLLVNIGVVLTYNENE